MKKTIISTGIAIIASLLFSSCVDLSESESVTALREAKSAQLQAMADMYRTQAAADSLLAAAEADLKAAQAEYQRLLTEQARQRFELEIEWLAMDYEYKMLQLEYEMQNMQQQILDAADSHIQQLFQYYKTEMQELNDLKTQLHQQNSLLAKADADILNAQDYVARETARYESLIADAESEIAVLEAYQGQDLAEIRARYGKAYADYDTKYADYSIKHGEMEIAYSAIKELIQNNYSMDNIYNTTHEALRIMDTLSFEYGVTISTKRYIIYRPSVDYGRITYPEVSYILYSISDADRQALYASLTNNPSKLEIVASLFNKLNTVYTAYTDEVSSLRSHALTTAYFNACDICDAAYILQHEAYLEVEILSDLVSSGLLIDTQAEIRELKDSIDSWRVAIAQLTDIEDAEDAKRQIEDNIAQLNELIAAQEQIVALAKADLDAALAQ